MTCRSFATWLCGLAALITAASALEAQQASNLPMGKPAAGNATSDAPAMYQFAAAGAGILTISVNGTGDLALILTDADGQPVPGGTVDDDLFGSTGIEQLMVTITEAGTYRLQIRQQDNGPAKFEVGAAWLAFPAFARPPDPDKRPTQARAIEIGKSHEDGLQASAGDLWDWFVITPKAAGTLTVILRPLGESQLDLTLELYEADNLTTPQMRSDQDLQGNTASESVTFDVKAGQKVFVKVTGGSNPAGKYRISSSLIQ